MPVPDALAGVEVEFRHQIALIWAAPASIDAVVRTRSLLMFLRSFLP